MTNAMHRDTFRAMGSFADLFVLGGDEELLRLGRRRLEELEARWSRFKPDSEVCAVNAAAGTPVSVSGDTLRLFERAVDGAIRTGGRFDPSLLPVLERLGYDRSFEEIGIVEPVPFHAIKSGGVSVDPIAGTVLVTPGRGFDPGGIGKGLAADLVAEALIDAGADGVLVNVGGDLRAIGDPPDDDGWTIGIEAPDPDGESLGSLTILDGAVATTTSERRSWRLGSRVVHHVLDPRTQDAATPALRQVTVIADEAWRAEVAAKALFVEGERWPRLARELDVEALVVGSDGSVRCSLGTLVG